MAEWNASPVFTDRRNDLFRPFENFDIPVLACETEKMEKATATRDCTVPAGTAFFVPVINFVNFDSPNVCGLGPDHVPVSDLRAAVAPFIDGATNLSITVDGAAVNNMRRIKSGVFAVTLPDDNLFDTPCAFAGGVPPGVYSPAIDDGYYAQVNALSAGAHVVHIHAESSGGFTLDVTYNLDVVATINH